MFFYELVANNFFKKIMETFHQPLPKILETRRNDLNFTGSDPGKNNESQGYHPRHHHRIGNRKRANMEQVHRCSGKSMVLGFSVGIDLTRVRFGGHWSLDVRGANRARAREGQNTASNKNLKSCIEPPAKNTARRNEPRPGSPDNPVG